MQTAPPTTAPAATVSENGMPEEGMPADPVIVVKDLSFRYPGADRDTLRNVDRAVLAQSTRAAEGALLDLAR